MTDDSWRRARELVLRHGWNATAYQILNPGMRLWFSRAGDAVAGYASFAGERVIAGAPVCRAERLAAVADELETDANAGGERLVFFAAGARLERMYAARRGHSLVLIGAQPVWNPRYWSDAVRHKASLRAQLHRASNKDVDVHEWPAGRARASGALHAVLREWLSTRGLPPLGFMVTPSLLEQLDDRRVFVAERGPERDVVGFLIATPIPARGGWLIEQWPRARTAPNGTTHLLVDAAMHAFAAEDSRYATLGLAPLSRRGGELAASQPAWLRVMLRWLRAHGRRFYNFRGLEAFKASLQPASWEPVFMIGQGRHFTTGMLRGVAGVFGGGSPEWLAARAIATAAGRELGALRNRRNVTCTSGWIRR